MDDCRIEMASGPLRDGGVERVKAPLIALAVPSIGYGGAEAVNVALGKEFLERGYRVDFVTMREEPETEMLVPKAARHMCLRVEKTRQVLLPLIRYLRAASPDALVASLWPFTSLCVLANKLCGGTARTVVCEHNTLSIQYANRGFAHDAFLRWSLAYESSFADASVSVSSGVADDLASLSGLSRRRFTVIHNPLLDRRFLQSGDSAAEAVWRGWRGPRLMTVGQFKKQKNHPMLIQAFKEFLKLRDARLLMLGEGDLLDATRQLVAEEGLADKVLLPGAVSDPTPYYRSADLFVLSSDYEGLGNVLIEALSVGLPVVSTDCKSGPAEILGNGKWGRLVPVGDAEALTRAMLEALDAEHDREALKRRAVEFSPQRIADQYLRLIFSQPVAGATA